MDIDKPEDPCYHMDKKEGAEHMSDKQMKEMIEFMDEKGLSDKEILDCFRRMCGANPSPSDQIRDRETEKETS